MKAGYWRQCDGKDYFIPTRLIHEFDDLNRMLDNHIDNEIEWAKLYKDFSKKFDGFVMFRFKQNYLQLHPIMICDPVGVTDLEEKLHDEYNF